MSTNVMILPAADPKAIRLVQIPQDMEEHEAFRSATGVIAEAQQGGSGTDWDSIADALEDHGFEVLDFVLGPELD